VQAAFYFLEEKVSLLHTHCFSYKILVNDSGKEKRVPINYAGCAAGALSEGEK
jgi:hypothetical protein